MADNLNKKDSTISAVRMSDFKDFVTVDDSNKVAGPGEIAKIKVEFKDLGISENYLMAAIDIVWHCLSVGSSAQTVLTGKVLKTDVNRSEAARHIKKHCTLRQFCAYYAPVAWELMLSRNSPPADWAAKGFRESNKFAAFDFLHGVTHRAAIKIEGGLSRVPTQEELSANLTLKSISIHRQIAKNGTNSVNLSEVTGGHYGAKSKLNLGVSGGSGGSSSI